MLQQTSHSVIILPTPSVCKGVGGGEENLTILTRAHFLKAILLFHGLENHPVPYKITFKKLTKIYSKLYFISLFYKTNFKVKHAIQGLPTPISGIRAGN